MADARNRGAHGNLPSGGVGVPQRSRADGRELTEQCQLQLAAKPSSDELLVAVHRALTGQTSTNPFAALDEVAVQLRGRL